MPVTNELVSQIDNFRQYYTDDEILSAIKKNPKYGDVSMQIDNAVKNGHKSDEIIESIKTSPSLPKQEPIPEPEASKWEQENPTIDFQPTEKASPSQIPEPEVSKWEQENPNLYAAKETALLPLKKFMQTDMTTPETIGMIAGGIGTGLINPLLAPVGGALGYAGVKSAKKGIENYIDDKSPPISDVVNNQLKDFKKGLEIALFGEMLGLPFKGASKAYSWIKKKTGGLWNPKQKASELIKAHTSFGDIYAKNTEEANKIKEAIPDIEFDMAQLSGGAKEGKLVRSIQITREGSKEYTERIAKNNQAILNYFQKNFPEKEGTIDDLIDFVTSKKDAITHDMKKVGGLLESETRTLMKDKDIQKTGETILKSLKSGEKRVGDKFKDLYKEIGDVEKIPANELADKIDDIMKPLNEWESSVDKNIPDIIKDVKSKLVSPRDEFTLKNIGVKFNELKPASQQALLTNPAFPKGDIPTLSLNNIMALKSEVAEEIFSAKNDIKPNRRLIKRLVEFQNSLDDMMKSETMGQKAKDVNEAFKKEIGETYRQGTVAKVLQQGVRGEESRVSDSLIAKEFFRNPDTADDFIKAVGKDKDAIKAMTDYASHDLLASATNPITNEIEHGRLIRWLFKNKNVLDKFKIRDKFNTVEKATEAMKHIRDTEIAFNKSSAAKLLNADPEQAIANAFASQGKNTGQVAKELLSITKDDKFALKGLKNAFGEYLYNKTAITETTIAGLDKHSMAKIKKVFAQYSPAIREMYKDEPEKIKALLNIQKAYEIMTRGQKSAFSGSDTIEKGLDTIARVVTPFVTGRLSTLASIKTAVHSIQKHERVHIEEFLLKATLNPDYAEDLIFAFTKPVKIQAKSLTNIDKKLRYIASYEIDKKIRGEDGDIANIDRINEKEM